MPATYSIANPGHLPGTLIFGFLAAMLLIFLSAFIFDPPDSGLGFWIGLTVILLVSALIGRFVFHRRDGAIVVSHDSLTLKAPFYGRSISLSDIKKDEIKVLDLKDPNHEPYSLKWRTNGLGLPRLWIGWFALKNDDKAWCYITDKSSVTYIPTTEGYAVMVSCKDQNEFISSLQNA